MGIRISDINKDKEEHFIMVNGSVYQEEILTLNLNESKLQCEIHKAQTDRTERRNWQIFDYNWRFQHPFQ